MQFQFYSLTYDSVQIYLDNQPLHTPVSLHLEPGQWAALYGPSGCGKTTLLRAALGFTEMHHGSIQINNEPLNPAAAHQLRGCTGYLPQRPYLGDGSVQAVVADLLTCEQDYTACMNLLPQLGLPARIVTSSAQRLSGGELQRLGIAVLLSRRPQLLLLDEPSSGLDAASRHTLLELLHEYRIGGLIISHDTALLETMQAQRITIHAMEGQV